MAALKYRALDLLKRTVYLRDVCDELTEEEERELVSADEEFKSIKSRLSEDELNWMYQGFAVWYDKFMNMETTMFIKPRGG